MEFSFGVTHEVRQLLDEAGLPEELCDRIEKMIEDAQKARHRKRSTNELVALKNRWASGHEPDDLVEHTAGFEGHVVELRKWRLEWERDQNEEELESLRVAMKALGAVVAPYVKEAIVASEQRGNIPLLTQVFDEEDSDD